MTPSSPSPPETESARPPQKRLGPRVLGELERRLSGRKAAVCMSLASALILALSVDTGFSADDYVHAAMLDGGAGIEGLTEHAPWDIFRFTTPETTATLQEVGIFSWWADPRAQLAFLRPISSLTHMLDHALWPASGPMQHLHNVLWALVVFAGIWSLYSKLLPPGLLLGLSFFLYALDDSRAWFSSWVAGRNTVIAAGLSIWALAQYIGSRQTGSRVQQTASYGLFSLALLAGEGSVAIGAYMLAYALFLDRTGAKKGIVALLPFGFILIAWRVAYKKLGYGAAHSYLYTDPGAEPLLFLSRLAERGPILWLSQLGGPWSDNWSSFFVFPNFRIALYLWALAALVLAVALLKTPVQRDKRLRFFGLGALLSTVPATAAFPADRLLNWMSIGGAPLLATMLIQCLRAGDLNHKKPRIVGWIGGYLVVVHLLIGPLVMTSRARGNVALRDVLERSENSVPRGPQIQGQEVFYLNPPAIPLAAYIPVMRAIRGEPRPKRQMVLSVATTAVTVLRTGPHTLRLTSSLSPFWNPGSQLLIDHQTRFAPGDTRQVGQTRITVLKVDERAAPVEFEFEFEKPLESPSYVFLQWDETQYGPFTPPSVGHSVELPAADYLQVLLGKKVAIAATYPEQR